MSKAVRTKKEPAEPDVEAVLAGATNAQLRAEIERRRKEHVENEKARVEALRKWVRVHVDDLLEVLPDHSRTSCSDENPCNDNWLCDRCILLRIKEFDYNTEWVPDIRFNKLTDENIENSNHQFVL